MAIIEHPLVKALQRVAAAADRQVDTLKLAQALRDWAAARATRSGGGRMRSEIFANFADVDVSGEGRPVDPEKAKAIAKGVVLITGMVDGTEIGLDVLLSSYVTLAVEQLGVARTAEALSNTAARLTKMRQG